MSFNINLINIRKNIIKMIYSSGSGHPGSSLSLVEILSVICFEQVDWNSKKRDRLILSKGHGVPALYSIFYELNLINTDDINSFRRLNSKLQGHPDRTKLNLIDAGTGALGQGISISIGYSLGMRMSGNISKNVYCVIGDGEIQEGQIWESAMFAAAHKISNLCVFVDLNEMQNEREVEKTLPLGDLGKKWESFGWQVLHIDGHNMEEIRSAISEFKSIKDRPTIIIAKTIKGKGVSFMEANPEWHGKKIDEISFLAAMKELSNESN
jgi:transketolase